MKSVFVVEDEPSLLELIVEVLSPTYHIDYASTSEEAFEKLNQHTTDTGIDLLLSDFNLKHSSKNGEQIADFVHAKYPGARIIIISGDNYFHPIYRTLPKPFVLKDLYHAVEQGLNKE
jgi:DNA-binding NtrC family response regulator